MIKETIVEIFDNIWPMIVIFSFILVSLRITAIICNKEKLILHKELFSLMFFIYILILFYIVTFQDNNYGFVNFTPFKEMFRYEFGTNLFYKNIVGNILLFMPLGLFVSTFIKIKSGIPILVVSTISSLSIEFTQMAIGRVFDIDDVILNIFGGILGYFVYIGLKAIRNKLPSILKKDWFLNIVIVTILIILILYFTNLHTIIWGYIR